MTPDTEAKLREALPCLCNEAPQRCARDNCYFCAALNAVRPLIEELEERAELQAERDKWAGSAGKAHAECVLLKTREARLREALEALRDGIGRFLSLEEDRET